MRAFVRLAERWDLDKADWPRLLGRSENTVRAWVKAIDTDGPQTYLDADVAERLSHLVSIYDGLHRLFGDPAYADRWPKLPNRAFGDHPPLQFMLHGFSELHNVRLYIERALAA